LLGCDCLCDVDVGLELVDVVVVVVVYDDDLWLVLLRLLLGLGLLGVKDIGELIDICRRVVDRVEQISDERGVCAGKGAVSGWW